MSFRWPTRRLAKTAPAPKVDHDAIREAIDVCLNGEVAERQAEADRSELAELRREMLEVRQKLGLAQRRQHEAPGT